MPMKRDYKKLLFDSFYLTWPSDGLDSINRTYNGKPIADVKKYQSYYEDPVTIITSFMRAPNQLPNAKDGDEEPSEKPSWPRIGNNLIGWQSNKSSGRKWINGFKALPTTIYYFAVIAFNTVIRSPIKLVTEFLFTFLSSICRFEAIYALMKLQQVVPPLSIPEKIGNGLIFTFASIGMVIFETLFIIGQAITSPFKGVEYCFQLGQKIATAFNILILKDATETKTLGGKILGGLLASFSAIISGVAITAAFFFLSPVIVTVGIGVAGAGAGTATVIGIGTGIMAACGFVATLAGTWLSNKWDELCHLYNRTNNAEPPTDPVTVNHLSNQFINEGQNNTSSPVDISTSPKKTTSSTSAHSHRLTDNFTTGTTVETKDTTPTKSHSSTPTKI